MQKLVSKMKTSWFAKASFVFVGIRCFSILGMSWSAFPDTQTYTVLDFTGVHTTRGWTLPLLYWIVRPNVARVAAQFLIATTAWITVAATFKKRIHHLRVQQLAVAGCFLVGVSSTVVGWDLALLSESLSISLGVLMICAWLAFARSPNGRHLAILGACTFPFAFIRQGSMPVLALVGAGALIYGLRNRLFRTWLAAGLMTLAATTWALHFSGQNNTIFVYNTAQILSARIFPSEKLTAWFESEGLPVTPDLKANAAKWTTSEKALYAMINDPALKKWTEQHGKEVYAKFVLTHPRYSLLDWFDFRDEFAAPGAGMPVRAVLPPAVEGTFISGSGAVGVLFFGALGSGVTLIGRSKRRRGDPHLRKLGGIVVALWLPWTMALWLTVVYDLGRIGVTTAVTLHLGVLALVCVTLDGAFGPSDIAAEDPAA